MVGGGWGRYILGSFLKIQNFMEVVGFKSSGFINSGKNRVLSHGQTAFG
jgi:hypothetical protein